MTAYDAIRKNKGELSRILSSDGGLILNLAEEKNLITRHDYKKLKNVRGNTEWDDVVDLVDKIIDKGEETCKKFLDLLQHDEKIKTNYPDLKHLDLNYAGQTAATAGKVCRDLISGLNDSQYINWIKAGQCLRILKPGLLPPIDEHMRKFHQDLLNEHSKLKEPCQNSCETKSQKCEKCNDWKSVIQSYRRRNDPLNWNNCNSSSWRTDHWELAKAYMPRGQANVKGTQFDTSALLHLIKYCKYFPPVDVTEMIRFRNDLMHSSDMKMSEEWMKRYVTCLRELLQKLNSEFNNEPNMAAAEKMITELLATDLSVVVPESDADMCQNITRQTLLQRNSLETELLKECVKELRDEDNNVAVSWVTKKLESLGHFMEAYNDLCSTFSNGH